MRGSRRKPVLSPGPFRSGSSFFSLSFRISRCPKDRRRTTLTTPHRDDVERRGAAAKSRRLADTWFPEGSWTFRGHVPNKEGGQHTVFLFRARSLDIRRHVKVRGAANPYDPSWELYFEERLTAQMANTLTGRGKARYLWLEQDGKC